MSRPVGTSIIFVNTEREVLLVLRDDIPDIRFPGMWDIPGGHLENGESPEQCIKREIEEEFGLSVADFQLFEVTEFPDRREYTFWQRADLDIDQIKLTEGQRLAWFSEQKAQATPLAFRFNATISSFFRKAPFKDNPA